MKIIILTIFLIFSFSAFGQSELETANQRLDKTLDILKSRDAEIAGLKDVIEKLKASQQTPCSIAITATENALGKLSYGENSDSKTITKARREREKFLRKIYAESLKSQCGWKDSARWYEYALKLLPLAVLLK